MGDSDTKTAARDYGILLGLFRWALVAVAMGVAAYASMFVWVISYLGTQASRADFAFGLLSTTCVVIAGTLVAPVRRWLGATMIAAVTVATVTSVMPGDFVFVGACTGAAGVIGWAIWVNTRQRERWTYWFLAYECLIVVASLVLATTLREDWYAKPTPIPAQLARLLGSAKEEVVSFYEYDLCGFIDSQALWRLEIQSDEVVARLVSELQLERVDSIPEEVWSMPPYWWPHESAPRTIAYQSGGFPMHERGPDGDFYFLVYDPEQSSVFVWYKSNF